MYLGRAFHLESSLLHLGRCIVGTMGRQLGPHTMGMQGFRRHPIKSSLCRENMAFCRSNTQLWGFERFHVWMMVFWLLNHAESANRPSVAVLFCGLAYVRPSHPLPFGVPGMQSSYLHR